MDEDYQQVALRKKAGEGPPAPSGRPRLVAAAVIVVFGLLVTTAAVQTSRNADVENASRQVLISRVEAERAVVERQQDRIARLQDMNIALEDRLDDATQDQQAETARARRLGATTGFGRGHRPRGPHRPRRRTRRRPLPAGPRRGHRAAGRRLVGSGCRGDLDQRAAADRAHRHPQPRPGRAGEQPAGEPAVHHLRHRRRLADAVGLQRLRPGARPSGTWPMTSASGSTWMMLTSCPSRRPPGPRLRHTRQGTSDAPKKNQEDPS